MGKDSTSHRLAEKLIGINVNARYAHEPHDLLRRARDTIEPADVYLEEEPTVLEWLKELVPTQADCFHYVTSLFPSASWIRRYNARWLLGDLVAGITIGLVVVPQAMAYALLAQLTPAYGLYTSFTGAILYWVFGTSKDIVIGTTAVGSLLVGQVISRVNEDGKSGFANEEIAHTLSMLSGAVLLFFGLLRLGWIIEFIPYIPISAFVTAASITIMSTQIPTALGIPGVNTREAPYQVLINTLKSLPNAQLDAAIGISSIVLLFAIRDFCAFMEKRQPAHKRAWSFASSLRLTFTMLLFTLISFLVHGKGDVPEPKFRIVGPIEPGFQHAGVPKPDFELIKLILPELPAVAIILVIEHIAIAKAMGRLYSYSITPSQEIVALGGANLLSPFVGGYVCTGSFGASAVLSKAGVRTPLAGLFSAMMLVLALYALTGVFFYIPNAALAGLIIHAVCNLIAPPKNLYKYWQLSPLELLIWIVCVALAIFKSLEYSIYVGIGLSITLLLVRVARTRGRFVGVARAQRMAEDTADYGSSTPEMGSAKSQSSSRTSFLPLDHKDSANPEIRVESPYPGVFIYRLSESFNYINQAFHVDALLSYLMENSKRMSKECFERESDRLWNDPGARKHENEADLPYLRSLVLDFSAVNNLDITATQGLIDLRNTLDRYSAPDSVEWHFANVHNRWTRRALAVSGFGYPTSQNADALGKWKPIYSIAPTEGSNWYSRRSPQLGHGDDEESMPNANFPGSTVTPASSGGKAAIYGVDRPFFHGDLHDAVEAAVRDAHNKDTLHNDDVHE